MTCISLDRIPEAAIRFADRSRFSNRHPLLPLRDSTLGLAAPTSPLQLKHMPFSGANAVPSSACLRCQLRCVLQHLRCLPSTSRRPYTPHRTFSTIYSRRAVHDSDANPRPNSNNGVYYKHITPNGRIVGKAGRKQRQTSEALATKSLGERSEIVIFRDVFDGPKGKSAKAKALQEAESGMEGLKGLSLTAEEIQAAMMGTEQAPDQDEVNASIDTLRPQAPVLEVNEFDRLIKELLDSYNLQQLSRYLRRSLASRQSSMTVVRKLEYSLDKTKSPRTISFTRTRWQPGRTPLEKRRISNIPPPKKNLSTPKARAAERIVRVGWEVTTKVEEQQMGELEVQMPPWALALFFDLTWLGRPKYETLIQPPILLRNAQVRPYRADGVMRITARRQDAEDIATQLENQVLLMGKQQLSIGHLIRKVNAGIPTGQTLQLFSKEQLELISQRTQSVFIQEKDGVIGIYSFQQPDRYNARRLLLSMLDLSSRIVEAVRLEPSQMTEGLSQESLALIPIFADRGLHFRDRSKSLARITLPERRKAPANPDAEVQKLGIAPKVSVRERAEGMSRALEPLTMIFDKQPKEKLGPTEAPQSASSYWAGRPFTPSKTWWIHLGLLLQASKPKRAGNLLASKQTVDDQAASESDDPRSAVFLRQVPGYETLLSFFKPNQRQLYQVRESPESMDTPLDLVARKSTIVAHFTPSPFTPRGSKILSMFPRLELTLLRRFGKGSEDGQLKIESLRGILQEQIIDVPLPDQAIDVRLSRKVASYANMPAVCADPHIKEFVSALNRSVKSGGSLHGISLVEFTLPGWMAKDDVLSRQRQDESLPEMSVPYLFDRFEQVQNTGFRKNQLALAHAKSNSALAQFDQDFPNSARLEYKEIEAGDIGGGHTDISFKVHGSAAKHGPANLGESPVVKTDEDKGPPMSTLLTHALAIADFVTRACRGEIRTWRGDSGLVRSHNVVWEEGHEEPSDEKSSSDNKTAEAVDETERVETSDETLSSDTETVEVAEDDKGAKTSDETSSADNELAKDGESHTIAQVSSVVSSGADVETVKAGEERTTVDADEATGSGNETVKAGEEDSAAEVHTRS